LIKGFYPGIVGASSRS